MNNVNDNQTSLQEENYLDFCESIDREQGFKDDYELIYKVWVLYDLYSISSEEIKHTIKIALDNELDTVDFSVIKRLLETAFIFANLDSNNYLDWLESNEGIEQKIIEVDKLRNKSYRIAISIYYYGKYLKEEIKKWKKSDDWNFFDNNIIIYRLFTRLWILTKSRDTTLDNPTEDIYEMDLQWKIEATQKNISNKFSVEEELVNKCWKEKFEIYFWENFWWFKNDEVYFSDYQKSVMKSLFLYKKAWWWTEWNSLAISAPTSAWKTFILKKYIIYKILESYINHERINIVFVVPSKALINELKWDFLELFKDYWIKKEATEKSICNIHTNISSDEFLKNEWNKESNLFIFTQERLNYFYSDLITRDDWYSFKINLAIVDEAHKVGYWYRWTLLSYIIWKLKSDNNNLQIILLAPLLSKLHKFKNEFWLNNIDCINKNFSHFWLVSKNKIIVSFWTKIKWTLNYQINYYLIIWNKKIELFYHLYTLEDYLKWISAFKWIHKMSVIPRFFSEWNTQSIIFRFWANTVIDQLKLLNDGLIEKNVNENELTWYINDILPKDFWLTEYLKSWISYHNWKLPISIKSAIENQFKNNKIKYLSANNTVLEGVNLPAKNIFILKRDYNNRLLSDLDIKNLVWRSWRLNEHLNWNVFFIDFNKKEEIDLLLNESITSDIENNISNILNDTDINCTDWTSKFDRFLSYIKNDNILKKVHNHKQLEWHKPIYSELSDFEYMLWYLISKKIDQNFKSQNYSFINKISHLIYEKWKEKTEKLKQLEESLNVIYSDIYTYWKGNLKLFNIIKKNIFIDPRKQINFYVSVLNGNNIFLNENIQDYSEILNILNDKNILYSINKQYWDQIYKKEITKKLKWLENLLCDVQKYFIKKFQFQNNKEYYYWNSQFGWENTILTYFNQWISSISLKKILWNNNNKYFTILDIINSEIQFNYLNAFSIYFELTNLAIKEYKNEDYSPSIHKLDTNFLYYMELGTFYPNLVYLISKWVSRESAIWLAWDREKKNWLIKLFPPKWITEEQYFQYINKEDKLLKKLKSQNKVIIKEELEKFIY